MRILIISPYFYPHKGGSQQYMEELHVHLMKINPDIKVDVIAYNTVNAPAVEDYRGMTIYRIPCLEILPGQFAIPHYGKLWYLIKILYKQHSYTFLNANTRFFESAWWSPWLAHHFKTTSILTDHCADNPTHGNAMVTFIASWIDRIIVPLFICHFDHVVATNQSTQYFLQKMGVKNVKIIYGGVDISQFKPSEKRNNRTVAGIDRTFNEKDTIVTFVGRMIYSKGPQMLYAIAQRIISDYPHVILIFAGGGEMYKKLRGNQSNNMYFLGSQDKQSVAHLLSQSDILVHPSLHHEGFPNVLLEAGSSGCAIVATDQGGTKEIILDGRTGSLVQPNQKEIKIALLELINNTNKCNLYKKNIRDHVVKHFDWETIAKEYKSYLDSLTS